MSTSILLRTPKTESIRTPSPHKKRSQGRGNAQKTQISSEEVLSDATLVQEKAHLQHGDQANREAAGAFCRPNLQGLCDLAL